MTDPLTTVFDNFSTRLLAMCSVVYMFNKGINSLLLCG